MIILINLRKLNIEFILSIIFFLLLFYVSISYTYPILKNLNLFGNLASFEINATWGRQLDLTKLIVTVLGIAFIGIIIVLRIKQLRN